MGFISRFFGVAVVATAAVLSTFLSIPNASAAPCPDVEVIFARGTFEPPGVGGTGQAFVDALRPQLGGKTIDVYPVNYPASLDFATAADGVIDASNKIRDTAANCPKTKMVLGGYSQGAAVVAYTTEDAVPPGFTLPAGITGAAATRGGGPCRRGGPYGEAVERVLAADLHRGPADHRRQPVFRKDH